VGDPSRRHGRAGPSRQGTGTCRRGPAFFLQRLQKLRQHVVTLCSVCFAGDPGQRPATTRTKRDAARVRRWLLRLRGSRGICVKGDVGSKTT